MISVVVALEKDLFFSVKIRDTLRHHDIEAITVRTLAAFEERIAATGEAKPVLVIVDTATKGVDWEAAIQNAKARGYPILAFGSHMDLDARERALKAGADKVVANSKFASDMPGLVRRFIGDATNRASDTVGNEQDGFEE